LAARKPKDTKKTKDKARRPAASTPTGGNRTGEVLGLVLIGLAVLVALALYSYHASDSNWIGPVGTFIAEVLVTLFGYSSYVAAVGLAAVGLLMLLGKTIRVKLWEGAGYLLLTLSVASLLYLHAPEGKQIHWGGATGMWIGSGLDYAFAKVGATILLGLVALLATILATNFSLIHFGVAIVDGALVGGARLRTFVVVTRERRKRLREKQSELQDKKQDFAAEAEAELRRRARRERLAELKDEREFKLKQVQKEIDDKAQELEEIERQAALRRAEEEAEQAQQEQDEAEPAAKQTEAGQDAGDAITVAAAEAGAEPAPALEVEAPPAEDDRPKIVESPAMKQKKRRKAEQKRFFFEEFGDYELPSLDLLDEVPDSQIKRDENEMFEMAKRLEAKLESFQVTGKVVEIHPGPVVTMYEYKPGRGIRVSKIANLATDLAMALESENVRIIAPIPGKAVVGIEVPNREREIVYFREIVASEEFARPRAKLTIALGKDIRGAPVVANLEKMPHLLIAGTTGSGKSVMLHTLLSSVLFRCSPDDVRLLIMDPKMIDMIAYDKIPHLMLPVVTDMKKASLALAWAVEEMERRYGLIAKYGARNISTFNKRVDKLRKEAEQAAKARSGNKAKRVIVLRRTAEAAEEDQQAILEASGMEEALGAGAENGAEDAAVAAGDDADAGAAKGDDATVDGGAVDDAEVEARAPDPIAEEEEIPFRLPYIVIIVDEFGDLMTVAARDVETSIQRLAQKARAAGIHLVLATQRPDASIITGVIKANFPSRIAFRVLDQLNSRVVLDQKGAEVLLGLGDMLYLGPGTSNLLRAHGAFVTEDEVRRLVEFLKNQGEPTYNEEILKPREDEAEDGDDEEEGQDEFYDQAVFLVTKNRKVSISWIQRQLQIGYNRAARLVERMEKNGVVSEPQGSKGREVLAPPPPE